MIKSCLEFRGTDPSTLLVTFGGSGLRADRIPPFEFLKSLNTWFPDYDKRFYVDLYQCWYTRGLKDITTNIPETKKYFETVIKKYKKVIFIGTSAGGYAAILFGSLLNISDVVAFIPQTFLDRYDTDERYRDLKPFINSTTRYHLYGDINITHGIHQMSHITRLEEFPNVHVTLKDGLSLPAMRDSGELEDILRIIVNS